MHNIIYYPNIYMWLSNEIFAEMTYNLLQEVNTTTKLLRLSVHQALCNADG